MPYNILCCDGGGIRGLLSAILLQNLPSNAISKASVFAGTSTGGIIAIGLAAGLDTGTIVNLYSTKCSAIFNPSLSPAASSEEVYQYLLALFGEKYVADAVWGLVEARILPANLFSAKYANTSLKSELASVLGAKASTKFSQLTRRLFVTTFQLDNGKKQWVPISFDNLSATSNDSTLLDAAMCTSAAPTYFPPYNHPTFGYCVDGGTFANNPSTFVLARVLQMGGIFPSDIRMLSIGTGSTANAVPASYFGTIAPEMWGTYQWMLPLNAPANAPSELLINLMMDGSSEIDDTQSQAVLGKSNYLRVEVPLDTPVTLDACSEVSTLTGIANKFMAQPMWGTIKNWVTTNFV